MATEIALEPEMDLAPAEALVSKYRDRSELTIALLQDIQDVYGYLPRPVLDLVSERLGLPRTQMFALATFYRAFSLEPLGEHVIHVCTGTACHVRGAPRILDAIERKTCCKANTTTDDLKWTIQTVNCLGSCALGPLVLIDGEPKGKMTTTKINKELDKIMSAKNQPGDQETEDA